MTGMKFDLLIFQLKSWIFILPKFLSFIKTKVKGQMFIGNKKLVISIYLPKIGYFWKPSGCLVQFLWKGKKLKIFNFRQGLMINDLYTKGLSINNFNPSLYDLSTNILILPKLVQIKVELIRTHKKVVVEESSKVMLQHVHFL